MLGVMAYEISVVVHDGQPEVEHSGEIPDGRYVVSGTPGTHGPEPSVRFIRHENYTGIARPRGGREGGL